MKILHISNDFLGSSVHSMLYDSLNKKVEQVVYVPLRPHLIIRYNLQKDNWPYEVIVSKLLPKKYTILFRGKLKFLYKDLKSKIMLTDVNMTNATTLFSDGGLALKIKQKHNIPYIVAVRSTDIDMFLKYRPDLIFKAIKILREAEKVIFISKSLKKRFLNHFLIKPFASSFNFKAEIIYNGIDDYWIKNEASHRKMSEPFKLLFVGRLIERKNVIKLCDAVINLNKTEGKFHLTIIGDGLLEKEIAFIAKENPDIIRYPGVIKDKNQLKFFYQDSHLFVMPAVGETFGLVYIEALSQGTPVIYCQNEGIDNIFDSSVGLACKPTLYSIQESILKIYKNYESYNLKSFKIKDFDWQLIALSYYTLFQNSSRD